MGEDLFRRNTVTKSQARLLFKVVTWMTERHGRPNAPNVPSPLKVPKTILTKRWEPSKDRCVQAWAAETFSHLKADAFMEKWAIQIAPIIDGKCNFKYLYSEQNWNPASADPYYIDTFGRAVITYDPQSCYQAGSFAARVLIRLAELQVMNFVPYETIDLENGAMIILASAAFSGQSFYLLPKAEAIAQQLSAKSSTKISADMIENSLIFTACLNLLALNRSPEQIIATYGSLVCPILRQKIRSACRQIERYETELTELKSTVSAKRDRYVPRKLRKAG